MVLIISLPGLVEMNSLCRKARLVPQDLDNQPKPQDPEIRKTEPRHVRKDGTGISNPRSSSPSPDGDRETVPDPRRVPDNPFVNRSRQWLVANRVTEYALDALYVHTRVVIG
jgi:hypothetical protein